MPESGAPERLGLSSVLSDLVMSDHAQHGTAAVPETRNLTMPCDVYFCLLTIKHRFVRQHEEL